MAMVEKYVTPNGVGAGDGNSLANALSWANMVLQINSGGFAGYRYNIDAGPGTYSRTTTQDNFLSSGSIYQPIVIRGFNSSGVGGAIGNGYQGRSGDYGLLNLGNMPQIIYTTGQFLLTGAYFIIESLNITSTRNGGSLSQNNSAGLGSKIVKCKITNSATTAASNGVDASTNSLFNDSDIALIGNNGVCALSLIGASAQAVGCHITGGTNGIGVNLASSASLKDCLIYNSSGNNINVSATTGSCKIVGCTIVGSKRDGISCVANITAILSVSNCLITDNIGYGVNYLNSGIAISIENTRFRDNGSGNVSPGSDWAFAQSGTWITNGNGTTDYTNSGVLNFSLISSSPAVSGGFPYPRSNGCFQYLNTASASGTTGVSMYGSVS